MYLAGLDLDSSPFVPLYGPTEQGSTCAVHDGDWLNFDKARPCLSSLCSSLYFLGAVTIVFPRHYYGCHASYA